MGEGKFERHRQPWRTDEVQKLHTLAKKGMALKAIAKALTRSEESVKDRAKAGTGPELRPGMFMTIEPMINLGRPWVKMLSDGWTAVTRDKSLSAQFEHSIGITETGNEIFTLSPTGRDKPPY